LNSWINAPTFLVDDGEDDNDGLPNPGPDVDGRGENDGIEDGMDLDMSVGIDGDEV
jgi:hypothetical protein